MWYIFGFIQPNLKLLACGLIAEASTYSKTSASLCPVARADQSSGEQPDLGVIKWYVKGQHIVLTILQIKQQNIRLEAKNHKLHL